ncbi:MAG: hypothetical protein NT154_44540 [Verrucomicrobia bacterium]|nr:hypothetical protein [Verrucomicrobiota bacterium]
MTNPAQPAPEALDAKPWVACAPVTTMPSIPDNPTEEVVKEILLTLDQMKFLHDDGPVVVRRSKTTARRDAAERLLLSVHGLDESWSLL